MTGRKWPFATPGLDAFGSAMVKREGHTQDFATGESHPTTEAEKAEQQAYFASAEYSTYMELCIQPRKQSREDIHRMVDRWLDDFEKGEH